MRTGNSFPGMKIIRHPSMIQAYSAIEQHLETCDAVFRIILEENRILKIEKSLPGTRLKEQKKALMEQLDDGLAELRVWEPRDHPALEEPLLERLRSRILQVLHIERENEQLLQQMGSSSPLPRPRLPAPSPHQLRGLYRV